MSKKFVMGDIHGNYRGLIQVLQRSGFDYKNDTLIQLGDICDGWSQTSECVDELLKIENLISIRGNHDLWMNDYVKNKKVSYMWLSNGGRSTINSYNNSGKLSDIFHKQFWDEQKDWYIDDQNRLFIHAGWDQFYGFPKGASLLNDIDVEGSMECHWDRTLWQGVKLAYRLGDSVYNRTSNFNEVYIGHTQHDDTDFNYYNVWNMDTGSGWHGKLTIMNIDTKEYFQSDYVKELYKGESGRG